MKSSRQLFTLLFITLGLWGWQSTSVAQGPKEWLKGEIVAEDSSATVQLAVDAASVAPGASAKFSITLTPQGNYYLYERSIDGDRRKNENGLPVLTYLESSIGKVSGPIATIVGEEKIGSDGTNSKVYKKPVTFTYEISIPSDQPEGEFDITGGVGLQLCDSIKENCLQPEGYEFRSKLKVAKTPDNKPGEVEWVSGSYFTLKKKIKSATKAAPAAENKGPENSITFPPVPAATDPNPPETNSTKNEVSSYTPEIIGGEVTSLAVALGLALVGGLILNLMPCVLPVIGLKVLSFVEQAGKDRRQIFLLNLIYSLGIISVFLALAGFSVGLGQIWGEQNQSVAFNITMMAIVFAMALSFLGVWEIPIPGFATTPGISRSSQRSGYEGAFLKGIVTTLLATPCSGPLLGAVFAFSAKLPAYQTFLVFFTVGLGMALPYLIIGAFPRAVKMLPKAGDWMETFKNLMGFLLLGTVVYFFTLIQSVYYIPTLILLFSIWFALWMVGRVPIYESHFNRLKPWLIGGPIAAALSVAGFWFYLFYENPNELKWKPYSAVALNQATSQGKTVLLDLTADWCPTCKWNLLWSINQYEVKQLVGQYDVVAMKADLSVKSPETDHLLKVQLQSKSIPILAVYPANSPKNPIVLRDVVQMQDVLDALKKAGPSKPTSATVVPTSTNKES